MEAFPQHSAIHPYAGLSDFGNVSVISREGEKSPAKTERPRHRTGCAAVAGVNQNREVGYQELFASDAGICLFFPAPTAATDSRHRIEAGRLRSTGSLVP